MNSTSRILAIVSGFIMVVAFILYIVSNATPSWGKQDSPSSRQIGLWRACVTIGETWGCGDLVCLSASSGGDNSSCSKMLAARAFVTIACIFSALSALCLLVQLVERIDSNRIVALTTKILPFVSLIAGIIGVAVGIAFVTYQGQFKVHVAAILGIVAVIINLVGAILALMVR